MYQNLEPSRFVTAIVSFPVDWWLIHWCVEYSNERDTMDNWVNIVKFYQWADVINEVDRLEGWYTLLNFMDP